MLGDCSLHWDGFRIYISRGIVCWLTIHSESLSMSGHDSSVIMLIFTSSSDSFCFGFSIESKFLLKNFSGWLYLCSVEYWGKLRAFTKDGTGYYGFKIGFFLALVVILEIFEDVSFSMVTKHLIIAFFSIISHYRRFC